MSKRFDGVLQHKPKFVVYVSKKPTKLISEDALIPFLLSGVFVFVVMLYLLAPYGTN